MPIYQLNDRVPQIDPSAFVFESATVIGAVRLGAFASLWSNVTVRGDNEFIEIGAGSNVQEGAVLHTDMGYPLVIEANVTVGHQAMLHGCTVGEGSLIGIQAVVLNGAKIGKNCLIGAGAIVTEGKQIPDGSLVVGAPGRVLRSLTAEEIARIAQNAAHYVKGGQRVKTELKRIG